MPSDSLLQPSVVEWRDGLGEREVYVLHDHVRGLLDDLVTEGGEWRFVDVPGEETSRDR